MNKNHLNYYSGNSRRANRFATLIVLTILFTNACGTASQPEAVDAESYSATATPFQPIDGAVDSLFSAPLPVQNEPTLTPYPAPILLAGSLPTPVTLVEATTEGTGLLPAAVNNPLTGLPASDPALLGRRPIAIKVSNSPDFIRPQSGLTLADVVFEYYIEWGDTRFIAVYYGNEAQRVGPVRSGRYFDEHVTRMYHAYYVFKGADPREFNYFKETDMADYLVDLMWLEFPCSPFEVAKGSISVYHRIFFNTYKFTDCLKRKNLDNNQQTIRSGFFSNDSPKNLTSASRIYTDYSAYSYNYWEYDASDRKYHRYQEANDQVKKQPAAYGPLTDALTNQQVTADNVVVLFAHHGFANSWEQEDEVYHIDLIESGEAFMFRDGTVIPARWYRTDIDQPLLLTTLAGAPIFFKPGVTFYQVIGESSTMTQSGSEYHFRFLTP